MLLDLRSLYEAVAGDGILVSVVETATPSEFVAVTVNPLVPAVFDAAGAVDVVSGGIILPVLAADGVTPVEAVSLALSSVVPGVQVVVVDGLLVGERRSVLAVGFAEVLMRHGAVGQVRAINGVVVAVGHTLEAVDL